MSGTSGGHRDVIAAALRDVMRGDSLSEARAVAVMDAVMAGAVPDAQFGALFALLHGRGETVEELVGFARSMRAHVVTVSGATFGAVDTCGTGGDAAGTFNVSTAAAFVAVGAGATVAKHGNRAVSSRCGSADVLEALGGTLDTDPADVAARLVRDRFAFMFAPAFHPSMRHAAGPRRALGIRTAFNFLGPITNPAGVSRQVVGVSDPLAAERIGQVLSELGVDRALVVHGADGLDELTITGSTIVREVGAGGVETYEVAPEDVGERRAPIHEVQGGDLARNVDLLRGVVGGCIGGAPRGIVVLNAAAALVVAGIADGLAGGADLAREAIDSGRAADALDRWACADAGMVAGDDD